MKTAEELKREIKKLHRVDDSCTLKIDEFNIKGVIVILVAAFKDGVFVDAVAYSSLNDKVSVLNKISYDMNIEKLKNY